MPVYITYIVLTFVFSAVSMFVFSSLIDLHVSTDCCAEQINNCELLGRYFFVGGKADDDWKQLVKLENCHNGGHQYSSHG